MRVLAFLALMVAAGCVAPTPTPEGVAPAAGGAPFVPPVPDFDFRTVVDPDHVAHSLPELHQAGHGLKLVGHASLAGFLPAGVATSVSQIDVWSHYALLSGMGGGLGFAIVDVADPAAPTPVGWFPSASAGNTARFSDDGQYVFYGCQMLGPLNPTELAKGTCEDPDALDPLAEKRGGIVAVDVRDKSDPKLVDFLQLSGSHNLHVATIGGRDVIATETTEIVVFDRQNGTLALVAEVPGNHDATIQRHPLTGQWLLFTGTDELAIYDVSVPEEPTLVYQEPPVDLLSPSRFRGWHEQTLLPGVVDGRVVLAVGGETMLSATGGAHHRVTLLDVSDPASPEILGEWAPPFAPKLPWTNYRFSIHEMAATPGGQIAIGWYHAGAWVIDASTRERQASPVTLAAYQPHMPLSGLPHGGSQMPVPEVPNVWGAGWDARGYLLVPDMHTGLYVLEPEWGLRPAVDGGQ